MNRLVALPLILVLLIGACCPRAHGSLHAAHSDGFAGRPHVHVSGEHDHHHGKQPHSHAPQQCELDESKKNPPAVVTVFRRSKHQQDAVYLADFSYAGRDDDVQKTVDVVEFAFLSTAGNTFNLHARCRFHGARVVEGVPSLYGTLPIYLAHSVLRL